MLQLVLVFSLIVSLPLYSAYLESWNDGRSKQAIIDFVAKTCDVESSSYVPKKDRIATFDQDGTLLVEHPVCVQNAFAFDRVKELVHEHPEWKNQEPFKSVLNDDLEAISNFSERQWFQIINATNTGMSTDEFALLVKQWLQKARHPRFKRPYTELVYRPMIELLDYLRAHGFKTYIVTGGGQGFVRVYSDAVYGIPSEQVIGSSMAKKYEYVGGMPVLMKMPTQFFSDNHAGKVIGINLFIGKRPQAAFGNSNGDKEMLEWTEAGSGERLMMLVHHDDAEREYAYGPAGNLPDTPFGTFSNSLMTEAQKNSWIIISMKHDWKRIF